MSEKSEKGDNMPWVEKYRPKILKDLIGFEKISNNLRKFLDEFTKLQNQYKNLKKEIQSITDPALKEKKRLQLKSYQLKMARKKAKLLIGPPGVGKTTIAYALANEYNMSVIELNASDVRTEDALQNKLRETVKSKNLLSFTNAKIKGKLILIDEVDGLHGQTDRGGVSVIQKIIGYLKFPILMTCNFRDKKLKPIFDLVETIEVNQASPLDISKLLKKITKAENIDLTEEQIQKISKQVNGDFRAAINDLQALAQSSTRMNDELLDDINMKRDTDANVQKFLYNMFEADTIKEAKRALDAVLGPVIDFRTVHKWINENILSFITKKYDLYFAFENLAHADRILGYIGRTQNYDHLSYYFDILAGGVRFSKSNKIISQNKIRPPRWFRTRAVPDDEIALNLQKIYLQSLNSIMREIRPNISLFLKYQPDIKEYLAFTLNQEVKKISKLFS